MNDEPRKSATIKIRLSILLKARHRAIDEGKYLGRWLEEAILEKIDREQKPAKEG